MIINSLSDIEEQSSKAGYLLRIQERRPLNLWTLRLAVGTYVNPTKIKILGEMKAWAYSAKNGLQLDTMQVRKDAPQSIGHLIWASTMAWALERTPCKKARLLAINDDELQYQILIRYFRKKGFRTIKEVGSSPLDLPLRLVWGGAGCLMNADCDYVYRHSLNLWNSLK